MDVAIGVAASHVSDRAIVTTEGFLGLFRQPPIAIEGVRVAGEKLAGLAVRYLVARLVHDLDWRRTNTFAADRAKLGELFMRMKHCHPSGLGRTIEFEEARVRKHFHYLALGLGARGRR